MLRPEFESIDSRNSARWPGTHNLYGVIDAFRRLGRLETARFAPGKLIPAALTIVSTPVFARVLGAAEYGVLAVATTATLLGSAVLFGWSEIVAVRELIDPEREVEALVSTGTVFFAVAAIVGAGTTVAFAVLGDNYLIVAAVSCATLAWGAVTFWTGAMRGRGNATGFVATATIAASGRAVLGVPAALAGFGPAGVVFGWAIGGAIACAVAVRRLKVKVSTVRPALPSKAFLQFAIPAAAVTSCFLALSLCDRLLIAAFRTESEVGTYALGYAIVEQSMVLGFSILQASGFPRLLTVFEERGYEVGSVELGKYITLAVTLVGAIALPLAVFGKELLVVFGGQEFAHDAAGFMPTVVLGVLLLGVGQYLSVPLQHERDTKSWARTLAIAAFVNIAANLALIPSFGLLGAGIATALGYFTLATLCAMESKKAGIEPLRHLRLWPCASAMVASGIVAAASLMAGVWYVGAVAAPLAYGAVIFLSRSKLDWSVA